MGRSDELRLVRSDLEAGRPGVVVSGAPGVGKTRLARDLVGAAETAGHPTRWATATRTVQGVPLGALAHLLPVPVLERRDPAALRRVAQALLYDEIGLPMVLDVDDVHFLDETSAAVLHDLASDQRCFLLMAQREGMHPPDAVTQLWKDGVVRRLELQPLGRAEVDVLVHRALGGQVENRTALLLWEATRGNVLYLRELLEEGLRQGVLTRAADGWTWKGGLVLSASLDELISDRIGRRSQAERAVLETVALAEPIELEALESLCDPTAVTDLERDGLIVVQNLGRRWVVSLNHPLYVEAVRARTPASAARRTRLALADWLEATTLHRGEDVLRIASLHSEAGGGTATLFVQAARRAWALGGFAQAEAYARAALSRGADDEARLLLGHALAGIGQVDEALAIWGGIDPSSDAMRASVAVARASVFVFVLGRAADGLAVLAEASTRITEGAARDLVDVLRATIEGFERVPTQEQQEALGALATASDPETATRAFLVRFTASLLKGRPSAVLVELDAAAAQAQRSRERFPTGGMWVALCEFYARLLAGDLDGAEALAARRSTEYADNVGERALWREAAGLALLERGRPLEAVACFDDVAPIRYRSDDGGWSVNRLHLGAAWVAAGDSTQATAALEQARAAQPSLFLSLYPEERVHAGVLRLQGRLEEALALLGSAARSHAEADRTVLAALLLHDSVRYGDTDRASELARLAAGSEGLLAALGEHAVALERGDTEALVLVARRLGDWGFAALANDVLAAPGAGNGSDPHHLAVMPRSGASGRAASGGTLTARERQVADLAAAGLSDRAIAERLVVSVRTVHAHLRTAYAKLGVSGRHELRL